MQLRRQVTLKIVITDQFKEETISELETAIQQVEQAKSQIDFRTRIRLTELQRLDLTQAADFRRRMEAEKQRQDELKETLSRELEALRSSQVGDEYVRGALEGVVDIQAGDNLQAKLGQAEIVIKDDVVVEIREPQPTS